MNQQVFQVRGQSSRTVSRCGGACGCTSARSRTPTVAPLPGFSSRSPGSRGGVLAGPEQRLRKGVVIGESGAAVRRGDVHPLQRRRARLKGQQLLEGLVATEVLDGFIVAHAQTQQAQVLDHVAGAHSQHGGEAAVDAVDDSDLETLPDDI